MRRRLLLLLVLLPSLSQAQRPPYRAGLGFELMVAPVPNSFTEVVQVGVRGRLSYPLNADVSLAGDLGFSSYLFEGRQHALLALTPQISLIATLLQQRRYLPYALFGGGFYTPLSGPEEKEGGPSLHAGVGWVQPLRESSFFMELTPTLLIGKDNTYLVLPVRAGVIF